MGDTAKTVLTGGLSSKTVRSGGLNKLGGLLSPKIPTAGASGIQGQQASLIAEQKRRETLRTAEATSSVKRRQAGAASKSTGRRSLIATSQTGLATTLGGS